MSSSDPMATFKGLKRNDQIFLGISLVLLIVSFFHFAGKGNEFGSYNMSVWNGIGLLAMILFIVAVAIVVVQALAASSLPEIPVSWNFIVLAATALTSLLIIIKALTAHVSVGGFSAGIDLRLMGYVLVIVSVALAGIAFMRLKESGDSFPWDRSGSSTPPAPPAPPAPPTA